MEKQLIAKRQSFFYGIGKRIKSSRYLIIMIIPAIIFYAIFNYVPMYGVLIAFTKYYPKLGLFGSPWIGFDNFKTIFADQNFWRVLGNTVLIGVGKILISFIAALSVALLINELRMKHFKKFVQIVVTFPHFLSWVVISGFVMLLFSSTGVVNSIIIKLGGDRINLLGDSKFFMALIFLSDIWKEAGWSSIIYIATMAGISTELYEAADIDGATRMQKIWNITLPSIKPTAVLLLIMSVGGILSAGFDQIFNLYNPLVYNVADILDTYIYRQTFKSGMNYGLGTAIGLFKSVVSFILVLITDRVAKACGERGII
ncbi:MAG: ABC transporter permease subunit [Bacilli bacterium]|nr:ABC transporter permease subunit [Bacilli bacterium]